jgi:hypothetical protein
MQHHNFNLLVREHTYRPALKTLLEAMLPNLKPLNDAAHWRDCGAPDFILVRRNDFIPVAISTMPAATVAGGALTRAVAESLPTGIWATTTSMSATTPTISPICIVSVAFKINSLNHDDHPSAVHQRYVKRMGVT